MGFLDALKGKKEPAKGQPQKKEEEKERVQKKEEPAPPAEGKYSEACSLCGAGNTEKKWMGQYWHKKCLRNIRKMGRKMI